MSNDRVELITALLNEAFAPSKLQVKDQSHLHAGHAGAQDGRGHYEVTIVAEAFANQRRLAQHRMIYDALGSLMETDIHALRMNASAPD
jgi:stress-induced morphogen